MSDRVTPDSREAARKRDLSTPKGLAMAAKYSNACALKLRRLGIGGKVQLTDEALAAGIRTPRHDGFGVITGFGNHLWTVLVQPSHRKTSSAYHVDFWKPVENKKAAKR